MTSGEPLARHMFRAYDIRGVVGSELTPAAVRLIGAAYATLLRRDYASDRIVLANDNRPSSPQLRDAFLEGLTGAGVSAIDIGLAPSPLMYFAAARWGISGGAVITASHSPTHMNGLKLLERDAIPISPGEITRIYELASARDFESGSGHVEAGTVLAEYLDFLAERFELARPLRVVADPGNGVATLTGPDALRRIGCEVIVINGDSDGTFPKHLPNPQEAKTMDELRAAVLAEGADLGFAWDGDGDRVGVVDETGIREEPDALLAVLAREALERSPAGAVLVDVKTSLSTIRDIEAHGGTVEIGPTGHSLAKRRMRHGEFILGGEPSAHYYFADHYNLDDAVYAACLIASAAAASSSTSQVFSGLPQFVSSPEIPVPCSDAIKFQIAEAVGDHFAADHDVLRVDGARINFPATSDSPDSGEGWSLIRASNTGPNLTIRFEATTEAHYEQIRSEILTHLRTYPELTIPDDLGAL